MGLFSKSLTEELYDNIESNQYLQEIFSNAHYNYALKVFKVEGVRERYINVVDAIRFADLLSKATEVKNYDFLRLRGQELAILLAILYPDNLAVKQCLGNVLVTLGNYRGLSTSNSNYSATDALEEIYSLYEKSKLRIPNTEGSYFFRDQKVIYNRLKEECLSFSGPTSMGKSFLIQTYIKQQVLSGSKSNFAIIVPTKALINEVRTRLINELKEKLEVTNYRVVVSSGDIALKQKHSFIFVLTPERLHYLLQDSPLVAIDFVFIDEAHNISANGARSTYYYKVVSQLKAQNPRAVVVFASPNVPNPGVYLKLVSNKAFLENHDIVSKYTPVCQFKFLIDLTGQETYCFDSLKQDKFIIPGNNKIDSLNALLTVVGENKKTLVYCSSVNKTLNLAKQYADTLPELGNTELEELARDIGRDVHQDCYLVELVKKGVAYHVGYLPNTIRLRIEQAFQKGAIHTIFCTSTLLEGVNLPADNLIITDTRNGTRNLTEIDYLNLVGRVGRIQYNLYGNIFLAKIDDKSKMEKFTNLFSMVTVPNQKLSLEFELTKSQKKQIIECLVQGDIKLKDCCNKDFSEDKIRLMRKFALILVHDIVNSCSSVTIDGFSGFLTEQNKSQIKLKFSEHKDYNDISIDFEQTGSIRQAIALGLQYPDIVDGNVDYGELVKFLGKLKQIFSWPEYEKSKLGRGEAYKWYAVILANWIQGKHIEYIIRKSIEYHRVHNGTIYYGGSAVPYDDSPLHKNIVISNVLKDIENVLLFSIASYFRRFSQEYKKYHNIKEFPNDWYEYIEYGTTNRLTIYLQQCGFSRDVATFIIGNKDRYVQQLADGNIRLKPILCDSSRIDVKMETVDVYYNQPDLFVV